MERRRLGLMEAYHAVHRFMVHIDATPEKIEEPTAGTVELIGGGFLSRVRVDDNPISQSAILALMRSMEDRPGLEPLLFSPIGYSNGAVAFADGRGLGLFDLTIDGEVRPVSAHARSLMPKEPLGPAFHDVFVDEPDEEEEEAPEQAPVVADGPEWKPCAQCGATNHPNTNYCANCGNDLTLRANTLLTTPGKAFEERGRTSSQPAPQPSGGPTLRCRTCGSNDIELIQG